MAQVLIYATYLAKETINKLMQKSIEIIDTETKKCLIIKA
jgi:hypothetical protein